MNFIIRTLVPVALALGTISAFAAGPVNNYTGDTGFTPPAVHSRADAQAAEAQQMTHADPYVVRNGATSFDFVPPPVHPRNPENNFTGTADVPTPDLPAPSATLGRSQ
jgi:hypothetical protein